jgi:hypothetical protein
MIVQVIALNFEGLLQHLMIVSVGQVHFFPNVDSSETVGVSV